jgi:hypothetical protein
VGLSLLPQVAQIGLLDLREFLADGDLHAEFVQVRE